MESEDDTLSFVQLILMLGKFHIHKEKWGDSQPNADLLVLELRQCAATIRLKIKKQSEQIYLKALIFTPVNEVDVHMYR